MKKLAFLLTISFLTVNLNAQDWVESTKIVASDRENNDWFGYAVDTDGDYAIVGAVWEDANTSEKKAGAAYIYERNISGNWIEVAKIVAPTREGDDEYGLSVSIDGNFAVVGAHLEGDDEFDSNYVHHAGSAYIYKRDASGVWNFHQKIVAPDRAYAAEFGYSVSIDVDRIVIGANKEGLDAVGLNPLFSSGAAYIYKMNGAENWVFEQKIVAQDRSGYSNFGASVSISGTSIFVGAENDDLDALGLNSLLNAGSAYFFELNTSETWVEVLKVAATDRAASDLFGKSLAIDGNYAIVGACLQDLDAAGLNPASAAGAAYVYEKTGGTWQFEEKIVASDRTGGDHFGESVSMSGDHVILGAKYEEEDIMGQNNLSQAGSAYVFRRDVNNGWGEVNKIVPSDRNNNDRFGCAVAMGGDYAIVGSYLEDEDAQGNNHLSDPGSAYIFMPTNININEASLESEIEYYPNPTAGLLHINYNQVYNIVVLEVYSTLGQVTQSLAQQNVSNSSIELSGNPGIYFLRVTVNGNELSTFKIEKR